MKGIFLVEHQDKFIKKIEYRFKKYELSLFNNYKKLHDYILLKKEHDSSFKLDEYIFVLDFSLYDKQEDIFLNLYHPESIEILDYLTDNGVPVSRVFIFTRISKKRIPWKLFPEKYHKLGYIDKSNDSKAIYTAIQKALKT